MATQDSFILHDVSIFTGRSLLPPSYLLVKSGRIAGIGTGPVPESVLADLPSGTPVLSKKGHTLIPGLIDAHIHADQGNEAALMQSLRFGVTTVCDMHNEHEHVEKLFKWAHDAGNKSTHSDFKSCGTAATIDGGWPEPIVVMHDKSEHTRNLINTWPKLKSAAEASDYVAAQKAVGASYIKLMHEPGDALSMDFPIPSLDLQKAVVKAAHEQSLIAVAHATCRSATIDILSCGVDGLTHTFIDEPPNDEVIDLYQKTGAHCNPTLAAMGSLTTEGEALQQAFAEDPLAQKLLLSGTAKQNLCRCMAAAKEKGSIAHSYATVRALHAAGVPIVVGSDAAGPALGTAYGLSMHQEMRLLVSQCGLTGEEVLRSATSVTAGRFGFEDRGVLETGRRADLVLIEGDVIAFLEGREAQGEQMCMSVKGVWREGVVAEVWKDVMQ